MVGMPGVEPDLRDYQSRVTNLLHHIPLEPMTGSLAQWRPAFFPHHLGVDLPSFDLGTSSVSWMHSPD